MFTGARITNNHNKIGRTNHPPAYNKMDQKLVDRVVESFGSGSIQATIILKEKEEKLWNKFTE